MNFEKHAFLLFLIRRLEAYRVPADKPHLQKTLFLIQEMTNGHVPFEFVYRNGPFSYEVDAELTQMRSYGAIVAVPLKGSGTSFRPAHNAPLLEKHIPSHEEQQHINFICGFVGSVGKPPIELDRQATVVWIMNREHKVNASEISERFRELKPDDSREDIDRAIHRVTELSEKAPQSANRSYTDMGATSLLAA